MSVNYSDKQLSIISAAERLFARDGFDGTSVRDIANEADVNVAMISYYFGSKEKLMEAVFESKTGQLRLKVENLLKDSSLSSLEKVYVLIDDYLERFLKQQTFHKIMMREQVTEKETAVSNIIYELKVRNLESIKLLIKEGQDNGTFIKNIDIPLMLTTMVGTISHMVTSKKFYCKTHGLEHLSDDELTRFIKRRLSIHLKYLFKQLLTHEE